MGFTHQCFNGSYIVGGYSASNASGDKLEDTYGNYDFWVLNLDSIGNIIWQNNIGGDSADEIFEIQQCSDGGFILGGESNSDLSGDKSEDAIGSTDYWVVRLDALGTIVWENTIGGSQTDNLKALQQCDDGGFILGGETLSDISGDKTEDGLGGYDYWIIKLDSSGNITWQNTIGGGGQDWVHAIDQTSDGGYIVGGYSNSSASFDKTEDDQGAYDYWVVKLDAFGNIMWDNTIGGSQWDELLSIQECNEGGYILGGFSFSGISGDKSEESQGSYDYWIVKLDEEGTITWQNTIGGSSSDKLQSVSQCSDGGYIVGGRSTSDLSGDKTEDSNGGDDYWVLKLNYSGDVLWQNSIGGTGIDILNSVEQCIDGGYILGGQSSSYASGDKTENSNGAIDYWIIKLGHDLAGCTNPLACNYNFSADTDDGSCLILGAVCDDGNDCTTNSIIHPYCQCIGEPLFPGDFNLDCSVDTSDLLSFLSVFGCTEDCDLGDLNGDGEVNTADLLAFLALFNG